MKKIILPILAISLMIILAACVSSAPSTDAGGEDQVATIVASTLSAMPTEAPTLVVPSAKLEDFPSKDFIGENERFSVFVINSTTSADSAEKIGQVIIYNKGTNTVHEIIGTFNLLVGMTIVYNDDRGDYVLLSPGTYTSRTAIVISLIDKKQAVNNFCTSSGEFGDHLFWNDYLIYNNCDKFNNRPWGAGEAPSVTAVNLKTGALTDIAKSDLMRQFTVKAIEGSNLQYVETSVAAEADWQNQSSQKKTEKIYDLSSLGK